MKTKSSRSRRAFRRRLLLLAALAATGQFEKQSAFLPMPEGFDHVPFGDIAAMDAAVAPDRVAAVKLVKPLLTPEQLTILEDAKNQWQENHPAEANDPSAN